MSSQVSLNPKGGTIVEVSIQFRDSFDKARLRQGEVSENLGSPLKTTQGLQGIPRV